MLKKSLSERFKELLAWYLFVVWCAWLVFVADRRGSSKVIGIVVTLFVVGALLPSGINMIIAGRNSSWSAGILAVWDVMAIIGVVGVLIVIVYSALGRRS